MIIIQVTSDGYDVVEDWRAGDWREWVWSMVYPVGMLVPSALIGLGIYWCVYGVSPLLSLPLAIVAGFLAYPFLLLSALEAGSPWTPVSPLVLESLVTVWWAWAVVYVESGLMLAGWLALVVFGFRESPWLTAAIAVPVLAGGLMIYARLLGRLAWYIDYRMSRKAANDVEE
jgi:hypothetical protein